MRNLHSKKIFITFFISMFCTLFSYAQNKGDVSWTKLIDDPNANFYTIQQDFNNYWAGKTVGKGKGYKTFKRWENYMEPRVYPSGDIKQPSKTYQNYNAWLLENNSTSSGFTKSLTGTWSQMGPVGKPTGGGAGRVNFIRFDPTTTNTIYVGTPDGGLWKSTNAGVSWTTNTDQISVIGCSDIAIDPTNTQIMYLATGDGDAGDSYSVGVLKSINGGSTWSASGLNWTTNLGRRISKLLMDPTNSSILLAATTNGIYRTIDAGLNWTQVRTGDFKDMEFKPGASATVYAVGTTMWKSSDNGATWAQITSGIPSVANVSRLALAVTPANAAYVYVLAGNDADEGLLGVYRSVDSGTNFTNVKGATAPNLLGWETDGSDAGGQAFYDLSIAASPLNASIVMIGGVNQWKSIDGGVNWTLNSHWYGGGGVDYVHADVHDLVFLPGSSTTIFSANDGGFFKTTDGGATWTDLSNNLTIAQQYRLSISPTTLNYVISGHQDNGTNLLNGASWDQVYGGDGMDCFIDRTNNNNIFASYVYGEYQKSTDGGASFNQITTSIPNGQGNASWLSVWHQDPVTATTIYAGGRSALYKTTNLGTSWSAMGSPTGSGNIVEFAIAPSNNQVIYAIKSSTNAVSKSTNGGTSFTSVTGTLPVTTVAPTNVAISNTDPNVVWITFSGYTAASKVYKSINGGTTWTNISTGLPNLPCNTIVYTNGSADQAVYLGTDVGVFYRDNTMSSWISFSSNLPKVQVRDLEIYYPTGRLRAATYGRGTWDSDLYTNTPVAPVANFTATPTSMCPGTVVSFTNTSTGTPTSYSWSFTGGTPNTSTATDPIITYSTPGTYTVSLIASNGVGTHTSTQSNLIVVSSPTGSALPLSEGFVGAFPASGWSLINNNSSATTWARSSTVGLAPTAGNAMLFDNYSFNDNGDNDEVRLVAVNLQAYTTAVLTFNVAYAPYNASNFDGLQVLVTTGCSTSYTSVYSKSNTVLATAPAFTSSIFVPTAAQWRVETINLTPYVGQTSVTIAFRNLAGYGQALYVDNINVSGAGSSPIASATVAQTSGTNPICVGSTTGFTVTPTNGGAGPTYQWKIDGANVGASVTTYSTSALAVGTHTVACVLTSNLPGVVGSPATSNVLTITINATPTVSNAGIDQNICASTTTLAGNIPTTGIGTWSVISGSATFTNANLGTTAVTAISTGANVLRWTIGNGVCTTSSDNLTITRNSALTTAVAGTNQNICGSSTTLAGNTPTVGTGTWTLISGTASITAINNPTTTIIGLANGNNVLRWTISGSPCTASTSDVTIVVAGTVTPSVSISTSTPTICIGTNATYTAVPTNGGTTPSYQWKVNGSNAGTNSTTFVSTFSNNQTVSCVMTSNLGCASPLTATSNITTITVTTTVIPSVSISTSTTSICTGLTATFTAVPTNGGSTPSYQWKVNGVNLGTNTTTFVSTFSNNQTVSCVMTSNLGCASPLTATSNITTITVVSSLTFYVDTDNDGLGSVASSITACSAPVGYVANSSDCDDSNNAIGTLGVVSFNLPFATLCSDVAEISINTGSPAGGAYYGLGVNGNMFDPVNQLGTVVLTYNVTLGTCNGSATETITIDDCTGITEITKTKVNIYPNPTQNDLYIELNSVQANEYEMEILNVTGQILIKSKLTNKKTNLITKIDVCNLANGVYIVNITSSEEIITKRITINR